MIKLEQKAGESDKDFATRSLNEIAEAFKTASEKSATKTEIKALETAIEDVKKLIPTTNEPEGYKEVKQTLKDLATSVEGLKESPKGKESKGVKEQIADWAKENRTALDAIKTGTKAELKPLNVKVNSPMTPSNTYSAGTYLPTPQFLPGVTEIVRVEPTFWDTIRKGSTNSATLVWVNKVTPLGAADFIGPGVAKPGISFQLQTETSVAKKVAESIKVSTEVLDDIDGMQSMIIDELTYQLKAKVNTTLLTGASSSTVPAGITTLASAFTLTTVKTNNPNIYDCIVACVAQLRSGNLQGPVTVFLNPVDIANMKVSKAVSQGQYIAMDGLGATIISDNNIAAGKILACLLDYYKVAVYKDMTVTFGWEDQDFTKNLVTAVCEMRIHQWFSANHTGAFIYDDITNVVAAIDGGGA